MKRRDFLKNSFIAGASSMMLPSFLSANSALEFDDYKGILVLFLNGGNDGVNTFIPVKDGNDEYGYSAYFKSRESIAVRGDDLSDKLKKYIDGDNLQLEGWGNNIYNKTDSYRDNYTKAGFYIHDKGYNGDLNFNKNIATHALMPEMAHYVNQGKVAIIQNVGNLFEPTTKKGIVDSTATLPPFLMAHDHQTTVTFTGNSATLSDFGLFGKLYDNWLGVNDQNIYGMNMALTNWNPKLLYGKKTSPIILSQDGIQRFNSINWNNTIFHKMMEYKREGEFKKLYNKLRKHSFAVVEKIEKDWRDYNSIYQGLKDSYGHDINFERRSDDNELSFPHANIGAWDKVLLSAAKLMKIGKDSGLKRQVVYISLSFSGFDTHSDQKRTHAILLRRLSSSLDKFQRVIKATGLEDEVTTVATSEFGRSVGSNGDGSDHAWGNHLFVLGGAVKGGLYGKAPSMKLGSDDDMNNKGRLIPTTSMASYYNTVFKWFGVSESIRLKILPQLVNFDPKDRDIGFMKS